MFKYGLPVLAGVLLMLMFVFMSCGTSNTNSTPEATYGFCETQFTESNFKKFFWGNLVMVAEYKDKGSSSADLIKNLVLNIVKNGIDYGDLRSYTISFENGNYRVSNSSAEIGFSIHWAQNVNSYNVNDIVPHNILDYETFITGVSISVGGSILNPSLSYSYNSGPLRWLIDTSIDISGSSLDEIDISFGVKDEYLQFKIASAKNYNGSWPWNSLDQLGLRMSTSYIPFTGFEQYVNNGNFGISYDGTTYNSVLFGITQNFNNSMLYVKKNANGSDYYIEGNYESESTKGSQTYWITGLASQMQQNYTDYFCNSTRNTNVGRATHHLNLNGGTFIFESTGATFTYDLSNY